MILKKIMKGINKMTTSIEQKRKYIKIIDEKFGYLSEIHKIKDKAGVKKLYKETTRGTKINNAAFYLWVLMDHKEVCKELETFKEVSLKDEETIPEVSIDISFLNKLLCQKPEIVHIIKDIFLSTHPKFLKLISEVNKDNEIIMSAVTQRLHQLSI